MLQIHAEQKAVRDFVRARRRAGADLRGPALTEAERLMRGVVR